MITHGKSDQVLMMEALKNRRGTWKRVWDLFRCQIGAVTTEKSTQVTAEAAGRNSAPYDYKAGLFVMHFSFTQGAAAGDIASTVDLVNVPPGKFRYMASPSKIISSAWGASRTLNVGWTAYTEEDGDAVVADPDGIHSAADVSAIATGFTPGDELFALGTNSRLFNSRAGVLLQAIVAGGTIPAGATLEGDLFFLK